MNLAYADITEHADTAATAKVDATLEQADRQHAQMFARRWGGAEPTPARPLTEQELIAKRAAHMMRLVPDQSKALAQQMAGFAMQPGPR